MPVAKLTGSSTAGSAATFIVSGLFHEVMFAAMMLNNSPQGAYQFGEALTFFMLMFAACCLPWWDTAAVTEVCQLSLHTRVMYIAFTLLESERSAAQPVQFCVSTCITICRRCCI
jgi:hypothetical protein